MDLLHTPPAPHLEIFLSLDYSSKPSRERYSYINSFFLSSKSSLCCHSGSYPLCTVSVPYNDVACNDLKSSNRSSPFINIFSGLSITSSLSILDIYFDVIRFSNFDELFSIDYSSKSTRIIGILNSVDPCLSPSASYSIIEKITKNVLKILFFYESRSMYY